MVQLAANGTLAHEAVGLAILAGVLLLGALVMLVLRTRKLPVCWNCGFRSVRRSHSRHHPLDTVARICYLYPRRCRRCLRRFYCFEFHDVVRHPRRHPMATGKG
jgi:hypothetical protein